MRAARFLLPLALSVSLVGCDAWFTANPTPDAMMDDGTMMGHSASAGMMGDDSMMKDDDSMMEGDSMMKKDEGMMNDEGMMKDAEQGMMKEDATASAASDAMVKAEAFAKAEVSNGSYGAYSPSVLANGQTKVLFFHAPWCPTCKHADAQLTAWYATHPFPLSTYKVDYDSETELKQRYGVTYQHTFVLVDGQGNALKVMEGPTDAQLQALLQS